jgi:hypothetical protein
LGQHNFPNQKQIDLLEVINYALYKKSYPQDTCGIIDRKIQLLKQAKQTTSTPESNLQLSTKKGFRVNFIRVINCLCELSFFTDRKGNNITKKEVFDTFGKVVNQDFSTFHIDLSATKAAANCDMRNTTAIFKQMYDKQLKINDK